MLLPLPAHESHDQRKCPGNLCLVPITFLAHQAPLLPLAHRFSGRRNQSSKLSQIDGIALAIGSMSPDFAYVVSRTPLMFWAHTLPAIVWFCVPATVIASWLVARVLAPVLPDHLPDLGAFHMHDYRGLATHRFTVLGTAASAAFGAWTHVVLDAFTHKYSWFAIHVPWYTRPLGPWRFRDQAWTLYRVGSLGCHFGLSALSLVLLYRYGRARWLSERAALVPPVTPTPRSHGTLWGISAVISVPLIAVSQRGLRDSASASILVMRISGSVFAALCVGAFAVGRSRRHSPDTARTNDTLPS